MKQNNRLVIHCAATKRGQNFTANDIRRWHKKRGWSDIGYNYVICRDGVLELGRDLDGDGNVDEEIGAHARGYNRDSIAVCLVGGVGITGKPKNNFTKKQFLTLQNLVREKQRQYPGIEVLGHRDLPNVKKACPSFDVKDWLKSIEQL